MKEPSYHEGINNSMNHSILQLDFRHSVTISIDVSGIQNEL